MNTCIYPFRMVSNMEIQWITCGILWICKQKGLFGTTIPPYLGVTVAPWCRGPVAQVPLHHRWSHWWFPTASHFFGKGGSMWLNHQASLVFHEFSHPESFLDSGKGWSIMMKKAFRFLITGSTWLADFKCWRLAKRTCRGGSSRPIVWMQLASVLLARLVRAGWWLQNVAATTWGDLPKWPTTLWKSNMAMEDPHL